MEGVREASRRLDMGVNWTAVVRNYMQSDADREAMLIAE
jgi:hypothetical protein